MLRWDTTNCPAQVVIYYLTIANGSSQVKIPMAHKVALNTKKMANGIIAMYQYCHSSEFLNNGAIKRLTMDLY